MPAKHYYRADTLARHLDISPGDVTAAFDSARIGVSHPDIDLYYVSLAPLEKALERLGLSWTEIECWATEAEEERLAEALGVSVAELRGEAVAA